MSFDYSYPLQTGQTPAERTLPIVVPLVVVVALLMGALVVFAEVKALVLCIVLLACAFIMVDFRIGVVCLIILMPISTSSFIPREMGGITGLNPLNLLLAGTLASLLLHRLPKGSLASLIPRPLFWWYLIPIVIAGVLGSRHINEIPPHLYSLDLLQFTTAGSYLRDVLLKPLFIVLFAVLVGSAVVQSSQPERLLIPAMISVWTMCVMAIVYVALSGASLSDLASARSRQFFSPLGVHANDLGRVYASAYALLLFTLAATVDARLRALLFATIGVLLLALILTFSRAGFFSFAIVTALFLLSQRRLGIILLGSVLLTALALLLPGAVYERIATGWGNGLNAISAGRVDEIWLPLLAEWHNSPLFGNGLGSILWSTAMRAGRILEVSHPHNAYLQALMDMGLVGLLLLCAYFVHVLKGFRRLAADPALPAIQRGFYGGAAAALIVLLIAGISGSSLTPGLEQIYLWLAIGMMYGQNARGTAKS